MRAARTENRSVSHSALLLAGGGLLLVLAATRSLAADPPSDWTATPLERCDREPFRLQLAGDAEARQRQFAGLSLRLARDARVSGASAQWDFTARVGTTEAVLDLADPPADLDGLGLWVKNPGGRPLRLSLRLSDAAGRVAETAAQPLDTVSRWTRYVFILLDLTAPEGQALQLPLGGLQVVLSGLQPGQATTVYIDEVEALTAPLPELQIERLQCARQCPAGQPLALDLVVRGGPLRRPVTIGAVVERAGAVAAVSEVRVEPRDFAAAGETALHADVSLPRHMANGTYRLRLVSEQAELVGQTTMELEVAGQTQATTSAVQVTPRGGAFMVDGRTLPVVGGWHTREHPCTDAPWVMVHLTNDLSPNGIALPTWKGPDRYEFGAVDELLARVLSTNPEAYLLPVIYLEAPAWWLQEHPKELMVFGDGKSELPARVPGSVRKHASWASSVWRQDCSAYLTKLIRHLEEGPLGPAVMGYQLAAGEGGYWAYPGASYGVYADYSQPQQEAFREWLKRKYTDLKTLRVAWGQPAAPVTTPEGLKESGAIMGWNQARVPSQEFRSRATHGVLHDPTGSQEVVDYQVFASDLVAEALHTFAAAADQAVSSGKIIGAQYGLVFDLASTACGLQNGGHLALGPVVQGEDLDYIVTPGTAGSPGGPPLVTTAVSSLANHGKLWVGLAETKHGAAGTVLPLCHGGVVAQEGFSAATWPDRLVKLLSGIDRHGVSEVAVVVDDISAAYTVAGGPLSKPLLSDQRVGLSLIGAPWDVWTLDDVLAGRTPRYRLYILLNAFYLDGNARAQLLQTLNAEPCTVIWVYAAGGIDQAVGGRMMKDLTGLTLVQRPGKGPVRVAVPGDPGYTYGVAEPFVPRFACVDDQADIRGKLVGTELGGLAVKQFGQVKSVWSAAPHLPASLLRELAEEAGVNLYATGGAGVYACQELVAVRAGPGDQRIRLPKACDVYDLLSAKVLARAVSEFAPGLAPGGVGLYYLAEPE